jgi:hypothetical protein
MIPTAHVVMHVAFCAAISRAPESATIPVQVTLINRIHKPNFDQTFTVPRGTGNHGTFEFDAPQGIYQIRLVSKPYNCAQIDYVSFIPDHNRNIDEKLYDGTPPPAFPLLMMGSGPESFLYLKPQLVFFDHSAQCNKPVGDPLTVDIRSEYDADGYYSWIYNSADLMARAPLIAAFQIPTPTGEYHYIRLKIPFPAQWGGWPYTYQFNISDGVMDTIATDPMDTLLCPRIYETSVG